MRGWSQKRAHKFKAKPTERDGFRFDSKKEARYYDQLKLLQQAGDVVFFLRQAPLHLPGNLTYRVDYVVFWEDGSVTFEDVKGYRTEQYKAKKKLVEHHYPIKIKEV